MKSLSIWTLFSSLMAPWADSRSEQELQRQFESRVRQNQLYLEQQVRRHLNEPVAPETQYLWSPDGQLRGWQQPDATGNIQQYDMRGTWNGTIYR
jgi:hypothetical protein